MGAITNIEKTLVSSGILTQEALTKAIAEAQSRKISVVEYLLTDKTVDPVALAKALAQFHKLPFQAGPLQADPKALALFPIFTLRRHKFLPLKKMGEQVVVATVDPGNTAAAEELKKSAKAGISFVVSTEKAITDGLSGTDAPSPTAHESSAVSEDLDKLMSRCITRNASDIHLEPQAQYGIVRERIDGVLYEVARFPSEVFGPLLSRIKVLAGMDIVEKRLAQDGHFTVEAYKCEVRASTLPTIHGEKMVLRLLRGDKTAAELEAITAGPLKGMIDSLSDLSEGLVLVAGPTGSGKSTTIYSILSRLDRKSQNLITVEDPVEYQLEMANQVQINTKAGVTFASILPTILRQDPDVIVVGEVRDEKTAQMCMRAAISGHLVLSTIHAPGALQTVTRLIDMEVPAYLISSALRACVSQRLFRKLCPSCKVGHEASAEEKELLGQDKAAKITLFEPKGCEACNQIGYKGRFAIMEVVEIGPELKNAILSKDATQLEKIAKSLGFKSLRDHASEKVAAGETTLKELISHCS